MKRVTGLGGFFFKTPDPKRLKEWYARHLGIPFAEEWDGWAFQWRNASDPTQRGATVWSLFPQSSDYFAPSASPFMCNFRVDNLETLLEELKKEGVKVDANTQSSEFGKFGWIYDPDGNKIELWEPPEGERG